MFYGEAIGEDNQTYIVCDCGTSFILEEDYQEHLETSHEYEDKIMFKCSLCEVLFDSEQACSNHIKSHATQMKHKKQDVSHKHVCEVCGKKYASKAALGYHQRVHTGERPYQCSVCPKSFTMPLFLQIHLRTHTGEKPYQCESCSKAFTNKTGLLRHNRVHSGEKPYPCPRCNKTFQQSNSMKLHIRTVHDKLPAPYKKNKKNKSLSLENLKKEHGYIQTDTANDPTNDPTIKRVIYLTNHEIFDKNVKTKPIFEEAGPTIKLEKPDHDCEY